MPTNISGEIEGKAATITNPLSVNLAGANLLVLVDEADSSTTYVGKASPGTSTVAASWQISKISVSGTVTTIAFADGNLLFDNVWGDRVTLTYL